MRFAAGLTALLIVFSPGSALGEPSSRVIAGDGKSAMDCVHLVSVTEGDPRLAGGGRVIANGCEGAVEIGWCYVDTECSKDLGNNWTVQPGRSWPVSAERELRWGACHGKNTMSFERGSSGMRIVCVAPEPEPEAAKTKDEDGDDAVLVRKSPDAVGQLLQGADRSADAAAPQVAALQAQHQQEWQEYQARKAAEAQAGADAAADAAAEAQAQRDSKSPTNGDQTDPDTDQECVGRPDQCEAVRRGCWSVSCGWRP